MENVEKKICCAKCGRELEQWEKDILTENEIPEELCSDCLMAQQGEEMSKTPHN